MTERMFIEADDGAATLVNPDLAEWHLIQRTSVLEFCKTCMQAMCGASNVGRHTGLWRDLTTAALRNGGDGVTWRGVTYTGPMLLDLCRSARRNEV